MTIVVVEGSLGVLAIVVVEGSLGVVEGVVVMVGVVVACEG